MPGNHSTRPRLESCLACEYGCEISHGCNFGTMLLGNNYKLLLYLDVQPSVINLHIFFHIRNLDTEVILDIKLFYTVQKLIFEEFLCF